MISIITRITELQSEADLIAFKYTHELSSDGWNVYDMNSMNSSDFTFPSSEEFLMKVVTDAKNVGGYTWNKLVRGEILKSFPFDENLLGMEDQVWFSNILCKYKNMRICCTNYILYCYVQHPNIGITRDDRKRYNKDGVHWYMICTEKELAIKDLPVRIKERLNSDLYFFAVSNLYQMGRKMTDDTRQKVKEYISKYAGTCYFRSKRPLIQKIKTLIKHILVSLHVYKY